MRSKVMTQPIKPHNEKAAVVWSAPGRTYDEMSRSMAPAIEHCVYRLAPRTSERALDIATGTGWASRSLAERGAQVTGVDFAESPLQAAREIAEERGLDIDYHIADAEALPYPDGHFDLVISTFGVMFAVDQQAAAAELARVTRKGGRLALASWMPEPRDAANGRQALNGLSSKVYAAYMPTPASPPPSPYNWGTQAWLDETLGGNFNLGYETGTLYQYFPNGEAAWDLYLATFGPLQAIYDGLADDRKRGLKRDMAAVYDQFQDGLGISVPIDYLLAVGTRR
jgi:ubiquinone/menaquinone biosynthesis C-methylase UbiE